MMENHGCLQGSMAAKQQGRKASKQQGSKAANQHICLVTYREAGA
jgi:hypothetical protein